MYIMEIIMTARRSNWAATRAGLLNLHPLGYRAEAVTCQMYSAQFLSFPWCLMYLTPTGIGSKRRHRFQLSSVVSHDVFFFVSKF